jgi:hypothetical protein
MRSAITSLLSSHNIPISFQSLLYCLRQIILKTMLRYLLLLSTFVSFSRSFSTAPLFVSCSSRMNKRQQSSFSALSAALEDGDWRSNVNAAQVSRRVALVTAAALAAGVSPVFAATTLATKAASLEKENMETVNCSGKASSQR